MKMRKILAMAAATLALVAGMVVVPSAAQADLTCSGTHIDTVPVKNGAGTVIARVGVYRTVDNTYCAVSVKTGSYYGTRTWMALIIHKQVDGALRHKTDSGDFLYQTNALSLYGGNADNRQVCIDADVSSLNGARTFTAHKCYTVPYSA